MPGHCATAGTARFADGQHEVDDKVTNNLSTAAKSVTEMANRKLRCWWCAHLCRPGLVEIGYCMTREDLPLSYGDNHPLRKLPADGGASCEHYSERK